MSAEADAGLSLKIKVGMFTILGILMVGAITVLVNDRPFWWRPCNLVFINVEDATGLKSKSPVRSLGLQIGYLSSVQLSETSVRLGVCITAPVSVIEGKTRAFIRGEGFLGDKFVELKPVLYSDGSERGAESVDEKAEEKVEKKDEKKTEKKTDTTLLDEIWNFIEPRAAAEDEPKRVAGAKGKEIPVGETEDIQQLAKKVDSLVVELTSLTTNVKQALNPEELRSTIQALNRTLDNASKTLSPEGGLTATARRTLAKLEDAVEQLRDVMTRINQGQGSVGMLLNDPRYAEEILKAIQNLNSLLGKVNAMRIVVDLGGWSIPAYDGSRGGLSVGIWPKADRYYLLGLSVDPRGKLTRTTTTTTVGNVSTTVKVSQVEDSGVLFTGMLGKVFFYRLDLAVGVLYGDATGSASFYLGETTKENRLRLTTQMYSRTLPGDDQARLNGRVFVQWFPTESPYLGSLYLSGGLDSIRKVNGDTAYFGGAGIAFDDQDIKLLFSFM